MFPATNTTAINPLRANPFLQREEETPDNSSQDRAVNAVARSNLRPSAAASEVYPTERAHQQVGDDDQGLLVHLRMEEQRESEVIQTFLSLSKDDKKAVVDAIVPYLDLFENDLLVKKLLFLFNVSTEKQVLVNSIASVLKQIRDGHLNMAYLVKFFDIYLDYPHETLRLLDLVPRLFWGISDLGPKDLINASRILHGNNCPQDIKQAMQLVSPYFLAIKGYKSRATLVNVLASSPSMELQDKKLFLGKVVDYSNVNKISDPVLFKSIVLFREFLEVDRSFEPFKNCVTWCEAGGYKSDDHPLFHSEPKEYPALVANCIKVVPYLPSKERERVGPMLVEFHVQKKLDSVINLMSHYSDFMEHGTLLNAARLWFSFPKELQTEQNLSPCLQLFNSLDFDDQQKILFHIFKKSVSSDQRPSLVGLLSSFFADKTFFEKKLNAAQLWICFPKEFQTSERLEHCLRVFKGLSPSEHSLMFSLILTSSVSEDLLPYFIEQLAFFCRNEKPREYTYWSREMLVKALSGYNLNKYYVKENVDALIRVINAVDFLPEESKKEQRLIPIAIFMMRSDALIATMRCNPPNLTPLKHFVERLNQYPSYSDRINLATSTQFLHLLDPPRPT